MSNPMFPVPANAAENGASDVKWFAGLAMQAIISSRSHLPDSATQREEVALWAWRMGQAMVQTEKNIHADDN